MELRGNWNYPTAIRFGAGRISELGAACRELSMSRPLLVTDAQLADHAITARAIQACHDAGISCHVFGGVNANPTAGNVEFGLLAYRGGDHDGVIAFGGGSGLDAAKAIAFMSAQDRPIWDFEDIGDNWKRAKTDHLPPVVAVPTTSGTGSEVGRASVITDEAAKVKKIIFHPRMLPAIALSDPELTLELPAHLTAATGMDALSHNVEAFFAPFYHPLARGIAVEGARLVKEWLPKAVHDGWNIEARSHMMVASQAGASAFQRGLGGMHALAHSLGALYGAHHGLLNAVLMPYVLGANRRVISDDAAHLAQCLGLNGFDGLLEWVLELRADVSIPHTLAGIKISDADSARVGKMAVADPSAGGNPIQFSEAQYAKLFQMAVAGNVPDGLG